MRTSEQTRRLAERVAELEQRKQDEGIFPDAIFWSAWTLMVPKKRGRFFG